MSWEVVLDPSEVETDRTELALDSEAGAIRVSQAGIDWGDAQITAYQADQEVGSSTVDYRLPNRTITIPLGVGMDDAGGFDDAKRALQQKIGLLQREGGSVKRAEGIYADVVGATLTFPDQWGQDGGVESGVSLVLDALPDFYSDEITLDTLTGATGSINAVLKESGETAVIEGDHPGRCRIIVEETDGFNDQKGLIWGLRSRHYDSASTAALMYSATAMTPLNGAAAPVLEDGQETLAVTDFPGQAWVTFMSTTLSSGAAALTHQGSYRVWARVYASASALQFQLRLSWGVGGLAAPVVNDPATVPEVEDWYLVDLGPIRIDAPPVGPCEWIGVLQAFYNQPGIVSSVVAVHQLIFQPLDEGAGTLTYNSTPPVSSISTSNQLIPGAPGSIGSASNNGAIGTVPWTIPGVAYAAHLATSSFGIGATSEYLEATDFSLNVPSSATILGIEVQTSRIYQAPDYSTTFVQDSHVQLVKGGTVQAANRASTSLWPPSWTVATYGSPTDLWGTTWTPAQINASDFGVVYAIYGDAEANVGVDWITVTVYYVLASGFTISQDAVVYKSETAELRTEGMFRTDPSGSVYGPVSIVTGDLPRIPPSGMEDRPVELFVKPSCGDLDMLADTPLNALSVTVKYRPSYLFPVFDA